MAAGGWYLFLAVMHFSNLRPLWNDEAVLLLSIQQFSSQKIFSRELLAFQVFPHVYFWLIKQFSALFSYELLSLRFFPFLAMIGAFYTWSIIARERLMSYRYLLLFFLSWTASSILVYYASELKQYSMDVLVAACFLAFVLHQQEASLRWRGLYYRWVLFFLPFLVLFSYAAIFFLVFPLWNIVRERKGRRAALAVYVVGGLVALGLSYCFDQRLKPAVIVSAWKDYFIVFTSPGDFFKSFSEGFNNLISRWFASKPYWVRIPCRVFMAFGVVEIVMGVREFWRGKDKSALPVQVIAAVVFVEMVVTGAMKSYPFVVPRTSLFFCPLLFLLTLLMFKRIEARSTRWGVFLQAAYACTVLFLSLVITKMALFGTVAQDITPWLF